MASRMGADKEPNYVIVTIKDYNFVACFETFVEAVLELEMFGEQKKDLKIITWDSFKHTQYLRLAESYFASDKEEDV